MSRRIAQGKSLSEESERHAIRARAVPDAPAQPAAAV
jgi:hypothetical protein